MNVLIYDIEILKAIPREPLSPGINYCDGWEDKKNMGISTITGMLINHQELAIGFPTVYCEDNVDEFQNSVNEADVVVDFNGLKHDKVVLDHSGITIPDNKHYDLLRNVWLSLGLDPDNYDHTTHGHYGLDSLAQVNLGLNKSGNGEQAPINWQNGLIGKTINYCMRDTYLLTRLIYLIQNVGYLISPFDGSYIYLPLIKGGVDESFNPHKEFIITHDKELYMIDSDQLKFTYRYNSNEKNPLTIVEFIDSITKLSIQDENLLKIIKRVINMISPIESLEVVNITDNAFLDWFADGNEYYQLRLVN